MRDDVEGDAAGAAPYPRPVPGERRPVDIAIAGASRSGSTILALMLGRHPDVAVLGETNRIAEEWHDAGAICGCGAPMQRCPFWITLAARVDFGALTTPAGAAQLRHVVREVTGAEVTVDTSKQAHDLRASNHESAVVHIVRDPRGIALSGHRGWDKSDRDGNPTLLRTLRVGGWWSRENLSAARLRRRRKGLLVRYEDFVVDHERICEEILRHVGLEPEKGPWREHHVGTGNPVRRHGEQAIVADMEWERRLPRRLQLACWVAALPLSALYRYPPVSVERG